MVGVLAAGAAAVAAKKLVAGKTGRWVPAGIALEHTFYDEISYLKLLNRKNWVFLFLVISFSA